MVKEIEFRHELKYVVSAAQIALLRSRVAGIMRPDPHAGREGTYSIRSLYFDDRNDRCYYENENGVDPREKFRIRIYDHSAKRISLECKRKERGKTRKTSALLTREQAEALISGKLLTLTEDMPPLLKRFVTEMRMRGLRPAVIVEYERIPYVYKNGNVRVTFDTRISSAAKDADFFAERLPKRPIMPVGQHLMEVKFDGYLPDVIYRALSMNDLRQTAYSKYYLCRRYSL